MRYEYVQVTIKYNNEIKGHVRFEIGEGNEEYNIHRADILCMPYLRQDLHHLQLTFEVEQFWSAERRLTEVFIPIL